MARVECNRAKRYFFIQSRCSAATAHSQENLFADPARDPLLWEKLIVEGVEDTTGFQNKQTKINGKTQMKIEIGRRILANAAPAHLGKHRRSPFAQFLPILVLLDAVVVFLVQESSRQFCRQNS